jgi:hypothetical protein
METVHSAVVSTDSIVPHVPNIIGRVH